MPMYQTKTIAGILEPVAQQVSKLIILHEEGEDGNAMPDLERPVQAVSKAVANLVRVGNDTINSSQDTKLKNEMPRALTTIEKASAYLEEACKEMKMDPYSQNGRDRLITGSRGILQGTTAMLVAFDESQIRKLCRDCKKVLDYLAISEVIETMEDLVQFVKDLSPCLSKVSHDIDARSRDLLNPYQRDALQHHLEQVKTLAPILICSMKIFIQILGHQDGKGMDEAVENRNYLAKRMTEEITEITRALEECSRMDGTDGGAGTHSNIKVTSGMESSNLSMSEMTFHENIKKIEHALATGNMSNINQNSIKYLVDLGFKIAESFEGSIKNEILSATSNLEKLNHQIGNNLGNVESRQRLGEALKRLETLINEAVINRIINDMADITTPLKQFTDAVTSEDNSIQRKRENVDQRGQNLKQFSNRLSKTSSVVAYANARNKRRSDTLHHLSNQLQTLTPQLINAGTIKINYPENKAADENFGNLRKHYAESVQTIRDLCDESIDVRTFLQQIEEHIRRAVNACEGAIHSRQRQTVIDNSALGARLSNRLLMTLYKESDNSDDPNLRRQVDESGQKLKAVIPPFVESSKSVAGSPGDTGLINAWKSSSSRLLEMVAEVTRLFAELNMYGYDSSREPNTVPINVPIQKTQAEPRNTQPIPRIELPPPIPPPPEMTEVPPPRPPLPNEVRMPARPPAPDTDDEEGIFSNEPGSNRPIHVAAHGLYQEVKQWDHRDNEIISTAKKIAYLMAHLSEIVKDGRGTKRELIACAKGLADASNRMTELSKQLAALCTDKKIRTNLLQVCEKIPTLGTQLRVLTTVKATMMGENMDSEEDEEAMELLVYNAQKLNEAVKDTVRAAESASIRVRSDAGFKLKWVRKPMWFNED